MSAPQSGTLEPERAGGAQSGALTEPRLIAHLRNSPLRREGESEMLAAWDALVSECELMRARLNAPVVITHAMRRSFDDAFVRTRGYYLDAGIAAVIEAWRQGR